MTAAEIGRAVQRLEDERFLTGRGRYVPDIELPRQARVAFVRSPHAHARVLACDVAKARAAPGVVAAFAGADIAAEGLPGVPVEVPPPTLRRPPPGTPAWAPPHYPALAHERVRYVGEAVALIAAETEAQARDAAELVEVAYQPLPAVTEVAEATAPGAPRVWDEYPGNLCFDYRAGDAGATEAAFARAAKVVRLGLVNNRIVASPLEPRGAIAAYDQASETFTLYTGTQKPHQLRDALAGKVFKVPAERIRLVSPDVGGGFGSRNGLYPEFLALLWAARRCGRALHWIAERTEGFLSDVHGRDNFTEAELALDEDGTFLAVRASTLVNLGAYVAPRAMVPTTNGLQMLCGPYRIAAAAAEVRGVFTHTSPTHVYRGAGRPEGAYVIERLVDAAARALGRDPAELRRRNLIPASALPHTIPMGGTYDGGDFPHVFEAALARADRPGFPARRAAAEARGRLRGMGLAVFVEHLHAKGHEDEAEIAIRADGTAELAVGSCSNGQGHETVFAQIAAARLGLPVAAVRVVQGDTARVRKGHGTGASRSLTLAGGAVVAALDGVIERGRGLAAALLEAAPSDVEFAAGRYRVAGTDRALALAEVAGAAEAGEGAPDGMAGPLAFTADHRAPADTFPCGAHVCEVEVDPGTGTVAVVAYTAVHDFGRLVNPMIVEGQVHGALAQGLGQALLERARYDPETGQLLSASFVDYALPRADDLPAFAFAAGEHSRGANALGVKGCGEAGCSGAPPALVNAVLDALAPLGVTDLAMPLTPFAVFSAIAGAGRRRA
ncbi:MAG: xanthine dehydrogenase family protein molybdopterin-binding subunit [Proteobacteria bacterium]|nr:xanthine dehydrogenase family protein molybdopterin-binding subunit [Pseudomonadota bacterium]